MAKILIVHNKSDNERLNDAIEMKDIFEKAGHETFISDYDSTELSIFKYDPDILLYDYSCHSILNTIEFTYKVPTIVCIYTKEDTKATCKCENMEDARDIKKNRLNLLRRGADYVISEGDLAKDEILAIVANIRKTKKSKDQIAFTVNSKLIEKMINSHQQLIDALERSAEVDKSLKRKS